LNRNPRNRSIDLLRGESDQHDDGVRSRSQPDNGGNGFIPATEPKLSPRAAA
jgi:hypothetical protein